MVEDIIKCKWCNKSCRYGKLSKKQKKSVMNKKEKLKKDSTDIPDKVIRVDEFFTEPLIFLHSFIAEIRTGLISKNASNCSNPPVIDLNEYIRKHLLKHSADRYVLEYLSIVNRVMPVCISIRMINADNKLITFAFYNEKHQLNHTDIEAMKNSVMSHENNIIIDEMKNCIMELHAQVSLLTGKMEEEDKVAVPLKTVVELKNVTSIIYCKADSNYTEIHYNDKSVQCVARPLKWIEKKLEKYRYFYRIHKSYIININYVKELRGREVTMKSGEVFVISIRRNNDFRKKCRII